MEVRSPREAKSIGSRKNKEAVMTVLGTNSTNSQTNATSSSSNSTSSTATGFASLTSADFMKMLIAELQNQDPTQPMSNSDLLNQLSQMTQLQSSTELSTAIQNLSANQQLSTAASYIGKAIMGTDANKNSVTGIVNQAFVQNGTAFVGVGNSQVPLANITAVASAPTS
jgi:flagellar basal-body rod modification protein FlgD